MARVYLWQAIRDFKSHIRLQNPRVTVPGLSAVPAAVFPQKIFALNRHVWIYSPLKNTKRSPVAVIAFSIITFGI
jgi:hypothetical protein